MSTKAERKRQEELRKRISLCLKVVFGVALLVLGVLYYHSNENNDIGDNYNTGIDTQKKSGNSSDKVLAEKETSGDKSSTKSEIVNKNEKNADIENMGPSDTDPKDTDDTGFGSKKMDRESTDENIKTTEETGSDAVDDDKININTAGVAELTRLNGIGEKRAADIIDYRNTHGDFENIDDIMKVKGIKQGIFSKIKDSIKCR